MDSDAQIRKLSAENRRLRRQVRDLKATRRRVEFSKIIFVGVSIFTVAIAGFSCRMIWITGDTSALAYLIPAVFAEMASATGFYYAKARAENQIKLAKSMPQGDDAACG